MSDWSLLGLIRWSEYRSYVFGPLRISFIVGIVLIGAVTFYETLRGQLDAATVALRTKERDEADARRVAAEAQLASLESRVNPHFLFNTLNSIAALTHENPAGAERMTNQLASLMRSSLDAGSAALVPLDQEVRVVRDYLEIERVRFGDRLRFTFDVPDAARERLVPRLSLQTLVENSVKFAVSPRREGGSIAVRAAVTDAGLRLEVEDDGPGFEPAFLPDGHGLALLKGRLAMMFGERGRLDVDSRPGRTLVAIDIRTSRTERVRLRRTVMPMLRAYVVDDERLAVQRLIRLLEATGRVQVVGSAVDPEAALGFLRAHDVDVLFLDIQMPGLTGFELLERLDRDVPVVFTTAYDRYALDAFTVNSVDYLLKPIEPERLDRCLDKLERLRGGPRPDVRTLARELAAQLAPGRGMARIASRVGERTTVLDVARITHLFSRDKLTFAVVNGREHVVDYTLTELEARLDPRRFVRIHRATIVNAAFVQELYPGVDGVIVRLKDDTGD